MNWTQPQDQPQGAPTLPPILMWNMRGRAVTVDPSSNMQLLMQQGFRKCDEGTQVGAYSPIYDRGDADSQKKTVSPPIPQPTQSVLPDRLEVVIL